MSGVVKQLAGGGGGQSLMDRVTAAKHSISGAGVAKVVCKATTEEIMAPKKKHLHYLIECTNESNVSIPELANELLDRIKHQNWVVVFKSLISMHNLMNYGNERFTQYLASNNCSFALVNFSDKSSVQGADMSRFICRYSAYVQEKAIAYRVMGFDFCKVKRGTEDAALRTMAADKILKSLTVLISQFDCLLNFDATSNELSNGVINAAFGLLYKDASRLFVVFNDGIINLLSKYFEAMNKKQCREALDIYKKFVSRSDRLNEFSKVAEHAGIERADLSRLEKHPASFLDAMESHLAHLEGRKFPRSGSSGSLGAPAATAGASAGPAAATTPVAEGPKLSQLLLEEQQQLDRLKAEQMKRKAAAAAAPVAAKPVALAPATSAALSDDILLMGGGTRSQQQPQQQQQQQQQAFFVNFPASNAAPAANFNNGFDPFGTVLQPISANQSVPANLNAGQSATAPGGAGGSKSSGLTGDLDSSLASLVGNLNMKQGQAATARQQGINWGGGVGGGGVGGGAGAGGNSAPRSTGVKIAAGPTLNWNQQQQHQQQQNFGQQQQQHAFSGGGGAMYPSASSQGQQLTFTHTQSVPAFRLPQQPQHQQSGWCQPSANQSNDPFGAL